MGTLQKTALPDRRSAGWALWGTLAVILTILVLAQPTHHTISAYREAAVTWSSHSDLYELESRDGFLYLPQSAIAFVPITWLPFAAGEVVWRLLCLAFFVGSVWALSERLPARPEGKSWFFLFSIVVFASTLASARNGQTNLPLAGCFLWIALALFEKRWTAATALLLLALTLKPIAVVPILLIGALYGPMRTRLLIGLSIYFALPFLNPHWDYVAQQYHLCWQKMTLARQPVAHDFCDVSGMLWRFGYTMSQTSVEALGVVMAGVVFALCLWAQKKVEGRFLSFWILALAACYLMLFNPRTEANSYVILSVALLPFLADARLRGSGACWETVAFVLLGIALGCDSFGNPIYPWTNLWFKPFLALGFFIYLIVRLGKGRGLFAIRPNQQKP